MRIELLEPKVEDATRLLASLANTKRLLIVCNLLDHELTVGALSEKVDLAQSALSQHLSKLRALHLVKARRDGQQVYYRLASDEVSRVLATLYEIYCQTDQGNCAPDAGGATIQTLQIPPDV